MKRFKKTCLPVLLFFWVVSITPVNAAVYIFDDVAALEMPVQLMVLTKGKLFPSGGKLVDIYLDGRHLGRIMSGGDGYGYMKFIPRSAGTHEVRVVCEGSEDTGMILVAKQQMIVLCIEMETGLGRSFWDSKSKAGMAGVLTELSRHYTLIYLSRFIGPINARKVLNKTGCPRGVTLRWRGVETFEVLQQKGLHLYAVIASAKLLADAAEYAENRFTFEESEDGTTVENWQDLAQKLKEMNHIKSQGLKGTK